MVTAEDVDLLLPRSFLSECENGNIVDSLAGDDFFGLADVPLTSHGDSDGALGGRAEDAVTAERPFETADGGIGDGTRIVPPPDKVGGRVDEIDYEVSGTRGLDYPFHVPVLDCTFTDVQRTLFVDFFFHDDGGRQRRWRWLQLHLTRLGRLHDHLQSPQVGGWGVDFFPLGWLGRDATPPGRRGACG